MTQTIEEFVVDGAFDLKSQLTVGKLRVTLVGATVVLSPYRTGKVDVNIEGIMLLLQFGYTLGD